jgi:uncharacterized membrane protein
MALISLPQRHGPAIAVVPNEPDPDSRRLAIDARWEHLILRVGLIATGAFIMGTVFPIWVQGRPGTHHQVVWLAFVDYGLAFGTMAAGMLPSRLLRRCWVLIPIAVVAATLIFMYVRIEIAVTYYGTDNLALSHIAAERLLDGDNPYAVNDPQVIKDAAKRFVLPPTYLTNDTDGKPVVNLMSWPAGSVLVFVPAIYLGVKDLRWVVVGFELAVLLLLWWRAPAALRPLVAIPLAADPNLFLEFPGGAVVDFIWVLPTLAGAMLLYSGRADPAALLFGLAAGTKQQPWLLAPFLIVWIWHETRDRSIRARCGACARFSILGVAGFLVLNLPFMIWDMHAWFEGTLLPFRADLIPLGSGVSMLTMTGAAALPKSFYSAATFGVAGVLLLAYALHFGTLKHAIWLAPAIIMWFGYRSLQNYFIFWTPMLLVALIATWETETNTPRPADAQ